METAADQMAADRAALQMDRITLVQGQAAIIRFQQMPD
jgi:hypothetical protein